ncbi:MAG TPA: helix-turn-helix domain-containing protein [Thermoanaerobaculia bacterium]|nr:helix-turn-helix domain-containing protein [Thermoanaerobaculia bacterium]
MVDSGPTDGVTRSFGEELRKEREIRGVSIKEIADATKVSGRFLEAIERNNFDVLPAPVFTRGFVREYARYLGLNTDDAVNRYMHFVEQSDVTGERGRFGLRDSGEMLMDIPPRRSTWIGWVIGLIVVVALAAAGWWWFAGRNGARKSASMVGTVSVVSADVGVG